MDPNSLPMIVRRKEPSPPFRGSPVHTSFRIGCDILTHPVIGSCECGALCEVVDADHYMLRRGSAWTGLRWASSGMPGWKKGAVLVQRMVERSTVRLRQLA